MTASRLWLSIRQVAEQAGCDRKVAAAAVAAGDLPAIKTADRGIRRIRRDHAHTFVDAYRAQHPQEAAT